MDRQQYNNLINFLNTKSYPEDLNNKQKQKFRQQAKFYQTDNQTLYQKNKQQILKVIKREEVETVLYNMHDNPLSGHFKLDATYNRIAEKYYWPSMRKDIQQYVRSCNLCQKERARKKNKLL